ncbi:hypothetical protein AK812_SmicGene10025 [Symbiodinium microadriaticum]|uniref:Uncharacterized protein n=1 Tax=Symbiodinium microadriaticum TaxID=2951 RepID=A0A1Q9EH01_SYMMI|nr:hypothetical protein AK812_SmicGene10025 [Symbiodinium microadriaticum]
MAGIAGDDEEAMRGEQDGDWRGTLNSFARRARAALAPTDSESLTVPLASRPADGAQTDAEMQDRLGAWARQAQQGFTQASIVYRMISPAGLREYFKI